MKKTMVLTAIVGVVSVGATVLISVKTVRSVEELSAPFNFVGLWQGIDADDGSVGLLSIIPKSDGSFEVLAQSTFFTPCESAGGQGFARGAGSIVAGVLVSEDRTIICANGETVPSAAQFVPNKTDDLLTAEFSSGIGLTFHRIGSQGQLPKPPLRSPESSK